jgi:hypothetical protein
VSVVNSFLLLIRVFHSSLFLGHTQLHAVIFGRWIQLPCAWCTHKTKFLQIEKNWIIVVSDNKILHTIGYYQKQGKKKRKKLLSQEEEREINGGSLRWCCNVSWHLHSNWLVDAQIFIILKVPQCSPEYWSLFVNFLCLVYTQIWHQTLGRYLGPLYTRS